MRLYYGIIQFLILIDMAIFKDYMFTTVAFAWWNAIRNIICLILFIMVDVYLVRMALRVQMIMREFGHI